jgi:hypothetical protein
MKKRILPARGAPVAIRGQHPREVHLHLHGVSAEDLAAILARVNEDRA